MELLREIIVNVLSRQECSVHFNISSDVLCKMLHDACFIALSEIKAIVENDTLDDFEAMEQIVCLFEKLNSNGGNRHDFG